MIVQKEFLGKLRDFGLNSYESRLWTALLSRGVSTAGELSDISNVPRSRTYDVLESLEKKGFIIMKLGKPIKYLAVPPDEVLDRVKKRVVEDSEHKADMLDKLRDSKTLEELKYIHQEGVTKIDPTDLSGSIRGRTQVYNHIDMLIKSSEESIDFMTTPDGFDRKMDAFKRSLKKAMGKGVKVRALISPGKVTETDIVKKIEIRKNVKVNARVVIIDKKHLILFLTNDTETHPSYDTGVWLGADFFGQAMQDFYGMLWQESK